MSYGEGQTRTSRPNRDPWGVYDLPRQAGAHDAVDRPGVGSHLPDCGQYPGVALAGPFVLQLGEARV